ncbi:MAG: Fe-S cluster assembly protein SufD [bacterium]|nr:Fe-S cluster assembly protein SufD [bacterium]
MHQLNYDKDWYEGSYLGQGAPKSQTISWLRKSGHENFIKQGFPTTKNEDWKYTDVTPIVRAKFQKTSELRIVDKAQASKLFFTPSSASTYTFVNGVFNKTLSNYTPQDGISFSSLASQEETPQVVANPSLNSFVALNGSLSEDGGCLSVKNGSLVSEPIYFVYLSSQEDGKASYPRTLINLEAGSSATLIEVYIGLSESTYFTNTVTEVIVKENAKLTHLKIGLEGSAANHIGYTAVKLSRDASYHSTCVTFGGKLVRNEICPILEGENIECVLNGLTVIGEEQHVDNHTVLDHAKPHCHSHELYKGIYSDKSSGVFSGTIIVRQDAQKTDAIQSNQSLLLSPNAKIETRPQLKIWADDVKCTHGATIGQLDENALFYLQARGIGKEDSRAMLVSAFAAEVTNSINIPELRDFIEAKISERLASQTTKVANNSSFS